MAKTKKVAAPAAEVETTVAAAQRKAPLPRGPRGVGEDAVITLLASQNPKRAGSAAEKRFALYETGLTVGAFLDGGGTTPDLVYDTKHGFIAISGYNPELAPTPQPRVAKPKAEKTPRKPKAPKAEAPQPTADAPSVEAEVVEEVL